MVESAPPPKKKVGRTLGRRLQVIPRSARSGAPANDLHYRGYDILEVAEACEFRGEIAHLLVHERLPTARGSSPRTATKLISLRGRAGPRSQGARGAARGVASDGCDAHPPCPPMGCVEPETRPVAPSERATIADRLIRVARRHAAVLVIASRPSGVRIDVETDDDLRRRPLSCICCTAKRRARRGVRAMHTSLVLYAEHEFKRIDLHGAP